MANGEGLKNRGAGDKAAARRISIIVPTFNEEENIRPLVERLFAAMKKADMTAEVWIMDDESKGSEETATIVKELQGTYDGLKIHSRKRSEGRGLSSAVLLGFEKASNPTMVCMDADLQHRPEEVALVAAPVLDGTAEMSVGSRHCDGGGIGFEWSLFRRIISKGGKLLSLPVAATTDPMSGFFCVRKDVLERGKSRINATGFKIGLEVGVRCRCSPVKDVAITFDERTAGESKLEAKVYRQYLEQLAGLYWDRYSILIVLLFILLIAIIFFLGQTVLSR